MTARTKALELFDRFYGIEPVQPIYIGMDKGQAKQCALICIDKMIETLLPYGGILYVKEEVEELEKVKQEVNKL